MRMIRQSALLLATLSPLGLAACGDGWTTQPYNKEPYSMERTAGSGVEYVRGMMSPQKGAVLEPQMEDRVEVTKTESIESDAPPPPPVAEEKDDQIVNEADHIFTRKQKK